MKSTSCRVFTLFAFSIATQFTLLTETRAQNSAIRLNGIDARGAAAGVGNLVSNSTWEAWIRLPQYDPNFTAPGIVLSRWGMWTSAAPLVTAADGGCRAAEGWNVLASGNVPGVNLSPGSWHHLATVMGPEAAPGWQFFVDGQLVQTVGPGGYVPSGGWETDLGCWGYIGYSGFLKADVDEARLSNVPRYTANFTPPTRLTPDASSVALWHFDEASGNIAHDATGNGFDFTLYGGYTWVTGVGSDFSNYCNPKQNSAGCLPAINASGSVSLSGTDNLTISASNILSSTNGVLIWSQTSANFPFHGGTLCLAVPIVRTPTQNSGNLGNTPCGGSYSFHFSHAYAASKFLFPGTEIFAQYCGRDPGFATPDRYGLTDGVRFVLTP